MTQKNFINSDNQSAMFGFDRFASLEEMLEAGKRYPYSLPIQASLAKTLKKSQNIDYEKFVKISAVLSPDRQWLYKFIHQPEAQIELARVPEAKEELPVEAVEIKEVPIKSEIHVEPTVAVKEEPVILIPEEPVKEEPEVSVPVFELTNIQVEEVQLPKEKQVLQDDSVGIITSALQKVHDHIAEEVKPKEPEIKEPVQPVEVKKPLVEWPETKVPKSDLLEREILKEAIDKTIQKEVSEIQPDFNTNPIDPEPKTGENPSGFQFWLNPVHKKAESREEKLRKIDALIEKFIKSEPRIVPKKAEFFSPANAAKQSVVLNDDVVSEPLALIFEKQGYFDKAIKAYEKLSLKIPEKRTYFAARIEKIREIVKNIKNNKE